MKKLFIVLLSFVVVCTAFAACSKQSKDQPTTIPTATAAQFDKTTTDAAVYKDKEAIEFIKKYSAEELGLTDKEKKECSYLADTSGVKIGDDYYIKVIAAYKKSEKGDDGKNYFKFDSRGEYFIRYDGKQVLKKDMKNKKEDKYTELKVKKVKTTEAEKKESEKKE